MADSENVSMFRAEVAEVNSEYNPFLQQRPQNKPRSAGSRRAASNISKEVNWSEKAKVGKEEYPAKKSKVDKEKAAKGTKVGKENSAKEEKVGKEGSPEKGAIGKLLSSEGASLDSVLHPYIIVSSEKQTAKKKVVPKRKSIISLEIPSTVGDETFADSRNVLSEIPEKIPSYSVEPVSEQSSNVKLVEKPVGHTQIQQPAVLRKVNDGTAREYRERRLARLEQKFASDLKNIAASSAQQAVFAKQQNPSVPYEQPPLMDLAFNGGKSASFLERSRTVERDDATAEGGGGKAVLLPVLITVGLLVIVISIFMLIKYFSRHRKAVTDRQQPRTEL